MRVLIIAAHGSRHGESNDEIRRLCAEIANYVGSGYSSVEPAFLEFAVPSVSLAVDKAVEAGATRVVVLPYFLAGGRHVLADIPAILDAKRREYPELRIEMSAYVGANPKMAELVANTIERSEARQDAEPAGVIGKASR